LGGDVRFRDVLHPASDARSPHLSTLDRQLHEWAADEFAATVAGGAARASP